MASVHSPVASYLAPSLHRRARFLARVAALALLLLAAALIVQPRRAEAAGDAPQPSKETSITFRNTGGDEVRVAVDGVVLTPRLPSAKQTTLLVEPGQRALDANGVATPDAVARLAVSIAPQEQLVVEVTPTAMRIAARSGGITPPKPGRLIRAPRPLTILSVLAALGGLAAATIAAVSQLHIERTRLADARASMKMQEIASRSLSALPALSMDKAARGRQFANLRPDA